MTKTHCELDDTQLLAEGAWIEGRLCESSQICTDD